VASVPAKVAIVSAKVARVKVARVSAMAMKDRKSIGKSDLGQPNLPGPVAFPHGPTAPPALP